MQFVANGPDIPERLLEAHEEGRVVFFCGAGISYPAELPGFGGLVRRTFGKLGLEPTAVEQAALKNHAYDTAIGLLESRAVGGRFRVRKALAEVLTPRSTLPRATSTHEALLTLSTGTDNRSRIITTNFDRLFEEVIDRKNLTLQRYCAPLLPIPKRRWDGLVYLHGLLPQTAIQSEMDRLVVSSGDFGLAYLTERWAARFVSELFRSYTVCFVGYSINDPVLRYMMDALAADRMLGEAPPEAFAFGNYKKDKQEQAANEWRAKNVTPILYKNHNKHSHLHGTLKAWAETYRDGIRGRESIVARYAQSKPIGSTRQDDFVGRMLWALSHPTGLPAKRFAELEPVPPIEWLDAFSEPSFLHRDLSRFGVLANEREDESLSFSLVARPSGYSHAPWMRIIQRSFDRYSKWDAVMLHVARWLLRHIDDPKLLLWAASQGDQVHEQFLFLLKSVLEKAPPSPPMQKLWQLVLSGRLHANFSSHSMYDWAKQLTISGLSPFLRLQLRDLLAPRVKLRKRIHWPSEDIDERGGRIEYVRDVVDWEVVLAADYPHSGMKHLEDTENWQKALPELLPLATELLRDAMDLMSALEGASVRSDGSHLHQPSIKDHPQNRTHRDWIVLINFTRDAWLAVAKSAPELAAREVSRWIDIAYPVFRRLALFATTENPDLFPTDFGCQLLLADDAWWLWSVETQRETFLLLAALAARLPDSIEELQEAVLAGPPRQMFLEDLEPEKFERIAQREIWKRLTTLRDSGGKLTDAAELAIRQISAAHPEWRAAEERDHFAIWVDSGNSWREFETIPTSRREIEKWLQAHTVGDNIHREDDWRERCRTDFPRTASALLSLSRQDIWPSGRWGEALQAWSEADLAKLSWKHLGPVLATANDDFISANWYQLAWWLKAVGPHANARAKLFFALVDRVLGPALVDRDDDQGQHDVITQAINHPIGLVAEAVLAFWYASGLEDDQGISGDVRTYFNRLASAEAPFNHATVLLCSNIITLFRVDRGWTTERLLPFFYWEAFPAVVIRVWKGFLWTARLYWPLLEALREPFLQTAWHYRELDEHGERYAAMLTYAALEQSHVFSNRELARATAALPIEGLEQVAQTLVDALESAGQKKVEQWDNRIRPYLNRIWPQSQDALVPAVSTAFSHLAIAAGAKFPEAVLVLKDWFLRSENIDFTLHRLAEAGHPANFPEPTLALMDAVVPDQPAWSVRELRTCLMSILEARPELKADNRFIRLEVAVMQKGLTVQ